MHAPLFSGAADRVAAGSGRGLARTALRQGVAAARLASGLLRAGEHDVAVAGSGGIADALFLRFLQNFDRVPLVYDAFIPLYDTVVRDRGIAAPGSVRARALLRIERLAGRVADLVLADTRAHAELLAEELGVPASKLAVVPVAQPDPGPPAPMPPRDGPLRVLLAATHVPLHGVPVVIEAARRLRGAGVHVTIVGVGQGLREAERLAHGVDGLELVPRFLPETELLERLRASHVGLGIFGDSAKAGRVVPLKAALVLAAGRTLVTRDSAPAREALEGAAVLVPPADADALAAALLRLRDDPGELLRLADEGRRRYVGRFTPVAAAQRLVAALAGAGLVPAATR